MPRLPINNVDALIGPQVLTSLTSMAGLSKDPSLRDNLVKVDICRPVVDALQFTQVAQLVPAPAVQVEADNTKCSLTHQNEAVAVVTPVMSMITTKDT